VEHNFEGISISSDDDEFGDASIECLGGFVGSLLDLLEGGALRDQIKDLGGEFLSCKGLGSFRNILNK
jgi:hypothetical protein